MYLAICDSAWTVTNGVPSCAGELSLLDTSNLFTQFDLTQLDPAILAAAFGAGFGIVATISVVSIAAASLLSFIKR
jgi:hypothetical protein